MSDFEYQSLGKVNMNYTMLIGGSGFIGHHLINAYLDKNEDVIVYGRNVDSIQMDSIIKIEGSLNDFETLESVFSMYPVKRVVHLVSGLLPNSDQKDYINELQTVMSPSSILFSIMAKFGINQFVFISSGGTVYGSYKESGQYSESDALCPINYYGLAKVQLEHLFSYEAKKNNIKLLIIRPSNPFGIFQANGRSQGLIPIAFKKHLQDQTIEVYGDGTIIRDFIPVELCCKYIAELSDLNEDFAIYNVGSGKGHSIQEVLDIIKEITQKNVIQKNYPKREVDVDKIVLDIQKMKMKINVVDFDLEKEMRIFYDKLLNFEESNGNI